MRVQRVVDESSGEVRLYCHSSAREDKERGIAERFCARLEAELNALAEGLHQPRRVKDYEKVVVRIGRLRQRYARVARYYDIQLEKDETTGRATVTVQTAPFFRHAWRLSTLLGRWANKELYPMGKPIRPRVHRSRAQWQHLIEEQQHSGLSQAAFCQRKDISPASLQNWKRRLAESEPAEPWLELGRAPSVEAAGWDIELDLGHGICLRLRRG